MQIYTMLADGTGVQQLTSSGRNEMPVWSKAVKKFGFRNFLERGS